ncbi:hypothetical protein [Flavobacterium chungbukense]|uniref:Gliding motility-associated protein GldM N-terminal domain-containing protein n=1 Tax=Flavobacterium chungbukense TaxID=877464 RepID=A0ABP7Y1C0_9FLAO|nr:hypothetical protein [Flavobacterium chungbukense]MCC4922191.1 hypothetical protein [Flavobacterium chungbukense]
MKYLQTKLVLFLLLSLNVCCQSSNEKQLKVEEELKVEKENSTAVISRLNEFREIEETSKEILKNIAFSKYEVIKIKNEDQPELFGELTGFATKIYSNGNEINDYIDEIKSGITEEDCFVTNNTLLYNAFVKQKYAVLKNKIDNFYKQNKVIVASSKSFAHLNKYNERFDTNKTFVNKENKKVNFLDFNFGYKANVGLLTSLEKMQFEVIHFQYMFMNTIMGSAH